MEREFREAHADFESKIQAAENYCVQQGYLPDDISLSAVQACHQNAHAAKERLMPRLKQCFFGDSSICSGSGLVRRRRQGPGGGQGPPPGGKGKGPSRLRDFDECVHGQMRDDVIGAVQGGGKGGKGKGEKFIKKLETIRDCAENSLGGCEPPTCQSVKARMETCKESGVGEEMRNIGRDKCRCLYRAANEDSSECEQEDDGPPPRPDGQGPDICQIIDSGLLGDGPPQFGQGGPPFGNGNGPFGGGNGGGPGGFAGLNGF